MEKQQENNPQVLPQWPVKPILISPAESSLNRCVSFARSPEPVASKALA
jgi:hypothetical protein